MRMVSMFHNKGCLKGEKQKEINLASLFSRIIHVFHEVNYRGDVRAQLIRLYLNDC